MMFIVVAQEDHHTGLFKGEFRAEEAEVEIAESIDLVGAEDKVGKLGRRQRLLGVCLRHAGDDDAGCFGWPAAAGAEAGYCNFSIAAQTFGTPKFRQRNVNAVHVAEISRHGTE